jgi:heme-degrading monooxygenase HmoA
MTTFRALPGKEEELRQLCRRFIFPAAERQPGFSGLVLMEDDLTGESVGLSVWESKEDMIAGQRSGYVQEQVEKASALLADPPTFKSFEVTVML